MILCLKNKEKIEETQGGPAHAHCCKSRVIYVVPSIRTYNLKLHANLPLYLTNIAYETGRYAFLLK